MNRLNDGLIVDYRPLFLTLLWTIDFCNAL